MKKTKEEKCCKQPDTVHASRKVMFEVDSVTHASKKPMGFTAEWCVNCGKLTQFYYTEL